MREREVVNARITGTTLGIEDHGILSYYLTCEFQSGGQGFGGYALDTPVTVAGKFIGRRGCAYGAETIRLILDTLEVGSWEKLPGTPVRIEHEWSKIHRIGHYLKDKWFDPTDESLKVAR